MIPKLVLRATLAVIAVAPAIFGGSSVGATGVFNPEISATYCAEGSADVDTQQLTFTCTPNASPGSNPDTVGSFDIGLGPDGVAGTPDDTGDYNFGGTVGFSQTVPDDSGIPVGAILGKLGTQPTLGLLNNTCSISSLRVGFTLMKGTTDNSDVVYPQPFGTSNDLALLAGDSPPYDGVQDIKPPPAVTKYPSYLNSIFDPDWVDYGPDTIAGNADDNNGPTPAIEPVFRAVGATSIPPAGNLWVILQLVVFEKGTQLPNLPPLPSSLGYPSVVVLQQASAGGSATPPAPSAITDFCTPLKTVSVWYGVTHDNPDTPANEDGIPVQTLPAAGTLTTASSFSISLRDADGDGYENTLDPCPFHADTVWDPRYSGPLPRPGDSDEFIGFDSPDGIPDVCDPTPTEPTGSQPADHDNDGFLNSGDNCPLHYNPDQADNDMNQDGEIVGDGIGDVCDTPGTDGGTDCVSDGCSGSPPRPIEMRTVAGNGPLIPDGAQITCVRWLTVVSGGNPAAAASDCRGDLFYGGNVDCDGDTDAVDALRVLRAVAGLPTLVPPGCVFDGDVDCGGETDAVDALRILRYVAKLPNTLPLTCPPIGP